MPVEFHPEAVAELEASARYYQQQQQGLGERFLSAIDFALAGVIDSPLTWPVLDGEVRRRLSRVFPYAILYSASSTPNRNGVDVALGEDVEGCSVA